MSYTKYEGLGGPDDVLEKIRDFLQANGFIILNNCTPDLDIAWFRQYDGKVLAAKYNDLYVVFRSANGYSIFPQQMNALGSSFDDRDFGIGMTACSAYTPSPASGYWYDQPNAPLDLETQTVIGVGIPVKKDKNVRLYANIVNSPVLSVVFSLELEDKLYQHLAFAETQHVGSWNGGMLISGSRNSYRMFPASWNASTIETESGYLYGMAQNPNTFLRVDVDAAPLRENPVLWAAAGPRTGVVCATGKILATPVVQIEYINSMPQVPHYGHLESQSPTDYGRNVNTLNCITVNLPIHLYVQRDPDALMNFSQVGYVPGVYAISMRNVAPGKTYEISYPKSGKLHQVFPQVKRKGACGYDGFSITQ